MTAEKADFPNLDRPPIVEVVCGVVFESVPELDALTQGVYWDTRKDEYPTRNLQPALSDEASFSIGGVFPMRAVLVSTDDQFVLQLQHDRFFLNWRARGAGYPRFSEKHGPRGLLVRTMEEFQRLEAFIRNRFGHALRVRRVDLSKIDLLKRTEHWTDLADLAKLLPVTGVFDPIKISESREVNLRFVERGQWGTLVVHLATAMDGATPAAVRVESRVSAPSDRENVQESLAAANERLNEAFFKLVPSSELPRFRNKEKADGQ